jgi:carboxypeptidase PM20D1
MKKIVSAVLLSIALLVAVVFLKALSFTSIQVEPEPMPSLHLDIQRAAINLSQAIQIKTISSRDSSKFEPTSFKAFHLFLEKTFPQTQRHLRKEVIGDYSLLYTWKGSEDNLKPILLTAHMDVVPIAPGSEGDWSYPPFAGQIAEHFIWGRGSQDDKGSLLAIMEALETLLADGFQPRRTIYLAFGHDEEVGGFEGAAKISALLRERNVRADWILDEGGFISMGMVPGISRPVALIGIAEKGYLTLALSVNQEGGHSSMPPPQSAIGILSSAIHHLERNPFPEKLEGATLQLFEFVGPEMPFGMKLIFANTWLFSPLIINQFKKVSSMNASIRTTLAPTIIRAGNKENVLPQMATAKVNFRLYPGDSIDYVIAHVKRTINNPRVQIKAANDDFNEASSVSNVNSQGFKLLERSVRQVFTDTIVAPFLLVGGTDTKHYSDICDDIFRFFPMQLTSEDLRRIHGTNERIGVDNYGEIIKFYIQMIRNSNQAPINRLGPE